MLENFGIFEVSIYSKSMHIALKQIGKWANWITLMDICIQTPDENIIISKDPIKKIIDSAIIRFLRL